MSKTWATLMVCFALIIISASVFIYRLEQHQLSLYPDQYGNSWTIEARVFFEADGGELQTKLFIPSESPDYSLVDEQFIGDGYTTSVRYDKETNNRVALFENPLATDRQVVLYRAIVEDKAPKHRELKPVKNVAPQTDRVQVVSPLSLLDETEFSRAMLDFITHLRNQSNDTASFVDGMWKVFQEGDSPHVARIRAQLAEETSSHTLIKHVLSMARIPFRATHRLRLEQEPQVYPFEERLQFWQDGEWRLVGGNKKKKTPALTWWYGDLGMAQVEGGDRPDVNVFYRPNRESSTARAIRKGLQKRSESWLSFSFADLPLETQQALEVLLLIPLGALIVVICRQFVGINTYGTFMPVLIAIAFRELPIMWGVLLFGSIITVGMLGRVLLDRLQLLAVSKLSAVLTVMVLGLVVFGMQSENLGLRGSLSIGLLPIIMLAMMTERITSGLDEYGVRDVLWTVAGTLLVASSCYLMMKSDLLTHLLFTFPELLLAILGCILAAGRYRGYRLSELYRFSPLGKEGGG